MVKVLNLPTNSFSAEQRTFKIYLNTDHIVLARPNGAGSGCVLFVDTLCSTFMELNEYDVNVDFKEYSSVEREGWINTKSSMIVVEESYEQVREMLLN